MDRARAEGEMRADRAHADIPMMMSGVGSVRRRIRVRCLAPLPDDHAGRSAGVVVSAAMAAERSRQMPRPTELETSPGTSIRCSTAPVRARPASRRCSTTPSAAPTRSPRRTPARSREFDGAGLADAMRALAKIQELVGRAGSYAMLRFATATADPERGALLQRVQERGTQIETALLFFELEWAALEDDAAEALLATTGSTSAATTCAPPAATGRTCCPSPRRRSSPRRR